MRVPISVVTAAAAAAMASAGCGASVATAASPGPSPSADPAHTCGASSATGVRALTLTSGDSGRTFCVTLRSKILVYLDGTPADRWSPIRASSGALRPAAAGQLTLMMGVTGASFAAVRTGTAVITSVRPLCASNVPPRAAAPASTPPCAKARLWRVTVVVRP